MSNPSKFYLEHIYKSSAGFHATWPPNLQLHIGDIILMDQFGAPNKQSSLEKEGIQIEVPASDGIPEMEHKYSSNVTINIKTAGEAPSANNALLQTEAGFDISFNSDRSLVFEASGCKTRQIVNLKDVLNAIVEKNKNGDWNKNYLIITQLVEASSATIIISDKKDTSLVLKAKASITTGQLKITDADLGLTVAKESGNTTRFIAQGALTPLYKAMALSSPWFGGKKELEVRDIAPAGLLENSHLEEFNPFSKAETTEPASPDIYAVLVGINEYKAPSQLKGCANDIKAVEGWLTDTYAGTGKLHIKRLIDEDVNSLPTRENIIGSFDFFSGAKNEDICLFYFCGHGTNLSAPPPFFTDSGTNTVQALVCRDTDPGNRYIVDKELSYLIWKANYGKPGLNFIVITDCCHSGTITRDVDDEVTVRALVTADQSPPLEEYAGYHDVINGEKAYTIMQDGPADGQTHFIDVKRADHLHFAAAMDAQKAGEIKLKHNKEGESESEIESRGAFTFALIKALRQNSRLSYHQLLEAAKTEVKKLYTRKDLTIIHEQTPLLNGNFRVAGRDKIFLTNESILAVIEFDLFYDSQYGWCLRAGLLDGLTTANTVQVNTANGPLSLIVKKVYLRFSILDTARDPDQKLFQPKCIVSGFLKDPLTVGFGDNFSPEEKNNITEKIELVLKGGKYAGFNHLQFSENGEATFSFQKTGGDNFVVTSPGNAEPVSGSVSVNAATEDMEALLGELTRVSTWQYIKKLRNEDHALNPGSYELNLMLSDGIDGNGNYIFKDAVAAEENRVGYTGGTQPAFRLKIKNNGASSLYFSCAYLDADYGISTDDIETLQVEPGLSQWIALKKEGPVIPLGNQKKSPITEYLKIFISNKEPIFLGTIEQAGSADRSIGREEPVDETDGQWQTATIGFTIAPKAR